MTGKEYVEQIKKIDTKIKNKHIEKQLKKQQYLDIALSICSGGESVLIKDAKGHEVLHKMERVQSSHNGQKIENAVIDGVDVEIKFNKEIEELEAKKQSIIEDIEKLSEPEYDVLHLLYVQHLTFDEAAERREKSKRWVASTHGTALQNLEKVSNCKELHEFA